MHRLTLHHKELDKKDQMKPRVSIKKEIITSQSRKKYINNSYHSTPKKKKKITPLKKGAGGLNRHFSKKDKWMANK